MPEETHQPQGNRGRGRRVLVHPHLRVEPL